MTSTTIKKIVWNNFKNETKGSDDGVVPVCDPEPSVLNRLSSKSVVVDIGNVVFGVVIIFWVLSFDDSFNN